MAASEFDFDRVIIGSGFGGSVSALRLSERGHRVLVLEKGSRRADTDYPESSWNMRNFLWAPPFGMTRPIQMSFTQKITVLHGCGVGGGSQIYANVNLVPEDDVFQSPAWTRGGGIQIVLVGGRYFNSSARKTASSCIVALNHNRQNKSIYYDASP